MKKTGLLLLIGLAGMLAALPGGGNLAFGNAGPAGVTFYANSPSGVGPTSSDSGTPISKFVDSMPGLGPSGANNLGQYIPIATKDTTTYPGSDYYQIGVVEHRERVHTNLPAPGTRFRSYVDLGTGSTPVPHYGGPAIIAERDRPVRLLLSNNLAPQTSGSLAGHLMLPVDVTLMGAGTGPDLVTYYTENRIANHLHGAFTPWISDGTPHTWFTPAGQAGPYLKGPSYANVNDMPDPGAGNQTFYYTNQQSGRFMFYHDHAVAITRLNVYAGIVAPYIIHDPVEDDLIDGTNNTGVNPDLQKIIPDNGGGVYKWGIPLIIQDKTFVPQDILTLQDTRWLSEWGTYGDLWYPHVYEPNQSLTEPSGLNQYGRWDFGPWVQPNILAPDQPQAPVLKAAIPLPGTDVNNPQNYNTCTVPEAFNDIMMVNGTCYPYMNVEPKAYRFRILNGCNDRFLNLQLYLDASGGGSGATATATINANGNLSAITVTNGGSGFVRPPGINITGGGGFGAMASATIAHGSVTGITITNPGSGYASAPSITVGATTEVTMVAAVPNGSYPSSWPKDGRDGGVPDPFTAGPSFIQIGNEGGILPGVTVRDNQPVNFDYDRGSATFGNVLNNEGIDPAAKGVTVFLGPAERADVIVDFSSVAPGTNVILYNDAPTPVPGFQPRYDYYTGNPDLTSTGGAPQTKVGVGPNTRTIMQFRVTGTASPPFDLAALQTALPNAYVLSQPPPIVPETYYPGAYQASADQHLTINATTMSWKPVGSTTNTKFATLKQKAITEVFDQYGRLQARLGFETFDPTANPARSNGVGFGYIDPPADIFVRGQVQIWKITHNGVDTHPIHIHLNNAQIINRVGWDGAVKPPEPFERGWKETIRMNPLEVIYIAQKADLPTVPFTVPYSIRALNPARPLGDTTDFTNINPLTGQPLNTTPTVNIMTNFGYEYVWHCHILAHEENDMMRPLVVTGFIPVGAMDALLLAN